MRTLPALLIAAVLIPGRSAPASPRQQLQTGNSRIVLATVVDGSGRSMVDFSVDDFVVAEGSRDRELLDVHIADYPLVVLLDDATDEARWQTIAAAARRFINRVGERPLALGLLTSRGALATTFDDDRQAQLQRLEELTANPIAARTAFASAARSAEALKALGPPFAAVVVVAASPIGEAMPASSELLPSIVASGVTIHVVQGQPQGQAVDPSLQMPDVLKLLAEQTRGQFTSVFAPSSYSVALDRLADRLSTEMMIEFLVPEGSGGGDVRVGVRRPGARVVGLGVSRP